MTNIKFDIKNLVYTVNEIKSMVEHAVNVLNASGSLTNQDNHSSSNLLNTESVPISNEQTLENVETELENATTRSQVVSVSKIGLIFTHIIYKLFFGDNRLKNCPD